MKLYASKHGGRYHQDPTCGIIGSPGGLADLLPGGWAPVTRSEARKRALTPCRVCKPPVLLTVITGDGNGAEW